MSTNSTLKTKTKVPAEEILPKPTDIGALANRINRETRSLHNVVDKMLTLRLTYALRDARIYRQGLACFYFVFAAIEKSLYSRLDVGDEWSLLLKSIWREEISRTEKFRKDLVFFYDGEKEFQPKLPEQIEFVEHIQSATSNKPYLLLAYMHVMYLALFAGGRMMRSSIAKAIGLFPKKDTMTYGDVIKSGVNAFTFDVPDEDVLRVEYKREYELLTRNNLTEEQKLEIIEESKYIFEQNAKCIASIERYNRQRIVLKWSYRLLKKGYYTAIVLVFAIIIFYVRKIAAAII